MLLLGNTFVGELGERARALLYASFLHGKYRDFVQVTLAIVKPELSEIDFGGFSDD